MIFDRRSPVEPQRTDGLGAAVVAFASAVKNLTIYPATHPRVEARAAEFAARFAELGRERLELVLLGERLAIADGQLPDEHLALTWLAQRCRETGLRGVVIERDCTAEDVLRLASAMSACRPGSGQNLADGWRDDTARVRPIALVVADTHADGSRRRVGELPPEETGSQALSALGAGCRELLHEVAERPEVQDLMRAIEAQTGDEHGSPVDLLGAIGELLPAEAPRDADTLAAAVEQILQRVQQQFDGVEPDQLRVRGAELLRSAVGVARRYFHKQAPDEPLQDELPSGRPEDERYQADVGALLAEYDVLPADTPALPTAVDTAATSPTMARELCGIYLHGLTLAPAEPVERALVELIARLAAVHAERLCDLLDVYLAPGSNWTRLPPAPRAAVVGALVAAGLGDFVRERGYLDEDFVGGAFPAVLRVAPTLFGGANDLPMLRRALARLEPRLATGGAEEAAKGGHLRDPAVVALLARVGGPAALRLLSQVTSDDPLVHRHLCAFAATLGLPEAEAALLEVSPPGDVPASWLRQLLRATVAGEVPPHLRDQTGQLLREQLTTRRSQLDLTTGLAAVKALRHAPGPETAQLLRHLATAGRFLNFTHSARLLRAQARAVLQAMQRSRP